MSMFLDVLKFMKTYGQPVAVTGHEGPALPKSHPLVAFRKRLLDEELAELDEAIIDEDKVEIADAITDCIYVLLGTAITYGIDIRPVWAEVQKTNMAKVMVGDPGKVKVSKPVGWAPPDIERALEQGEDLAKINTGE